MNGARNLQEESQVPVWSKIPFRHMPRSHMQTNRPISYLLFVNRAQHQSPPGSAKNILFPPLMVKRWPSHVYCEAAIITQDNRKGAHREAEKQWSQCFWPILCSSSQKHWATTAQDFNFSWWVLHKTSERTGLKVNLHKCHSQPDTELKYSQTSVTANH